MAFDKQSLITKEVDKYFENNHKKYSDIIVSCQTVKINIEYFIKS